MVESIVYTVVGPWVLGCHVCLGMGQKLLLQNGWFIVSFLTERCPIWFILILTLFAMFSMSLEQFCSRGEWFILGSEYVHGNFRVFYHDRHIEQIQDLQILDMCLVGESIYCVHHSFTFNSRLSLRGWDGCGLCGQIVVRHFSARRRNECPEICKASGSPGSYKVQGDAGRRINHQLQPGAKCLGSWDQRWCDFEEVHFEEFDNSGEVWNQVDLIWFNHLVTFCNYMTLYG